MDLGRPFTITKARVLIGMVHYYRNMWPRRSPLLAPITEADSGTKGRKILWNGVLENPFKETEEYVETLLSYTDWKLPFIVHTDESDKQLGAVISQNNQLIIFFSRKLIKPQRNYITAEK